MALTHPLDQLILKMQALPQALREMYAQKFIDILDKNTQDTDKELNIYDLVEEAKQEIETGQVYEMEDLIREIKKYRKIVQLTPIQIIKL